MTEWFALIVFLVLLFLDVFINKLEYFWEEHEVVLDYLQTLFRVLELLAYMLCSMCMCVVHIGIMLVVSYLFTVYVTHEVWNVNSFSVVFEIESKINDLFLISFLISICDKYRPSDSVDYSFFEFKYFLDD